MSDQGIILLLIACCDSSGLCREKVFFSSARSWRKCAQILCVITLPLHFTLRLLWNYTNLPSSHFIYKKKQATNIFAVTHPCLCISYTRNIEHFKLYTRNQIRHSEAAKAHKYFALKQYQLIFKVNCVGSVKWRAERVGSTSTVIMIIQQVKKPPH